MVERTERTGFTLIELLVVSALIALLLSIMVPALNIAKELSRGIPCLANQKTLVTAYTMYADDNGSKVCVGFVGPGPVNGLPRWANCPGDIDGTGRFDPVQKGNVTLEQRQNGLRTGALFGYIENVEAYHCPGDKRMIKGTSEGNTLKHRLYRSYSLPHLLRAEDPQILLSSFTNPGSRYLFVEDYYDGRSSNNYDFSWSYNRRSNSLWDPLGTYHSKSATFGFMDGHAEQHKWNDPRTTIYFRDRNEAKRLKYGKGTAFNPPNEDLLWLDQAYPMPK
jgi:prepilin-type N-terminal cleavage/methylation domain-containing protein/prepilin-type processing-associated H-X9-DG protein